MKAKYAGSHPEVEFKGVIYRKGEEVEVAPELAACLPKDFTLLTRPTYTRESLLAFEKTVGWREFQKWARAVFGVTDSTKEKLVTEILATQGGHP